MTIVIAGTMLHAPLSVLEGTMIGGGVRNKLPISSLVVWLESGDRPISCNVALVKMESEKLKDLLTNLFARKRVS